MQTFATFTGSISFGTHYRANRAVVTRRKLTLFLYGVFIGVPALVFAGLLIAGHDISCPSVLGLPAWLALLLGPLYVFLFLPLCHALNVWQMRRKNVPIHGALTWTVTTEGFESRGGTFDVRIRWDAINRIVETKEFFLFYIAATTAHFIPKACAVSAEDLTTARTIIKDALGDRAKLRAD